MYVLDYKMFHPKASVETIKMIPNLTAYINNF